MSLDNLTAAIKEKIKAIAAQYGAYNVRVFGSVAKGKANQSNELDFLVEYDLDKISP